MDTAKHFPLGYPEPIFSHQLFFIIADKYIMVPLT